MVRFGRSLPETPSTGSLSETTPKRPRCRGFCRTISCRGVIITRWVAITAVLALNAAAQPSWKRPGACMTPQGTLCRTLVYESSGWANSGWGFHNIDRYEDRMIEAVRSDGSALLRITHRRYKHYLIASERYDRTRVVLPANTQTYEIDHSRKEVRDLGGVWRFSEYWTDDADCQKRAANAGENWRKTGGSQSWRVCCPLSTCTKPQIAV